MEGAPDLIIEVLSPTTAIKDKREKKSIYEKYGVKEYILIHPDETYAERYILHKNVYQQSQIFGQDETIKLTSLKGVKLNLKKVFEGKRFFI